MKRASKSCLRLEVVKADGGPCTSHERMLDVGRNTVVYSWIVAHGLCIRCLISDNCKFGLFRRQVYVFQKPTMCFFAEQVLVSSVEYKYLLLAARALYDSNAHRKSKHIYC